MTTKRFSWADTFFDTTEYLEGVGDKIFGKPKHPHPYVTARRSGSYGWYIRPEKRRKMKITNIYESDTGERLYSVSLGKEELRIFGSIFGKPLILRKAEKVPENKIPAIKKIDDKLGFTI